MMQKEHFTLSPMQDYSPPAYPDRGSKPPETLKKFPLRWAKNAAVFACIGVLSLGVLVDTAQGMQPPVPHNDGTHGAVTAYSQDGTLYAESGRSFDVVVRTHFGGSGAGPFYVAYLTEQEALGIIRNRLSQAGIPFDSPIPTNYVATLETPWETEITARLSLFHEDTRKGIVFPRPWSGMEEFHWWEMPQGGIERALQQQFAERFGVAATFMDNPGHSLCRGEWQWEYGKNTEPTFTDEEKQEAGGALNERLIYQVDTFIDQLRAEGILPPAAFPFADVSEQHWARQAIEHVWRQGIMTGTTRSTFAPNETLTRAQVAAILWRMAGEPAVEFQEVFDDVWINDPIWFRDAVIWANENSIVQGHAGRFHPSGEITREQFAAMLHRYAKSTGSDVSVPESFSLDKFDDHTQVSAWAVDYMRWAVYHGLISGTAERTLSPLGTATRAETAMILMRLTEEA